jgi:hypothetical protein
MPTMQPDDFLLQKLNLPSEVKYQRNTSLMDYSEQNKTLVCRK